MPIPQSGGPSGQAAQAVENDHDAPQTVWEDHANKPDGPQRDPVGDSSRHGPEPVEDDRAANLHMVPQRFSYEDLKRITDDFKKRIGAGGFGPVFFGKLSDGTPVAVKIRMRSPGAVSSSHGDSQFSAEVSSCINMYARANFCSPKFPTKRC